jgi:signal peptide peptidase SppA
MKNPVQLIDAFFRKPLLIEEATLRMILAALNASAAFPAPQAAYGGGRNGNVVTIRSEVAVIPILNILSYRSLDYWSYLFSDTTYQDIRRNFRQALGDSAVSAIVLDVASPGGGVEGVFDLADEIYQARGVKPIYAMINESALSAAYLLASSADKVFLPRTGFAGSIGTLAVHIDESGAESEAGLKYTEIYSGNRKVDGSPHAPLTEEARAIYQKFVDQNYDLFIETVARNRGLKPADVRAQQAAIYTGKEAVAAGLADAVLSWDAAWKKVIGAKTKQGGTSMKTKLLALFEGVPKESVAQALLELGYVPKPEQGSVILAAGAIPAIAAALGLTAEQLAGDLSKVDYKAAQTAAIQKAQNDARTETLAYVNSIHEICALGGQEKMAPALIKEGVKIEDARAKVLAAKAQGSDRTHILSTIGGVSADGPNILLADAKKRAAACATKK